MESASIFESEVLESIFVRVFVRSVIHPLCHGKRLVIERGEGIAQQHLLYREFVQFFVCFSLFLFGAHSLDELSKLAPAAQQNSRMCRGILGDVEQKSTPY